jgi:predicted membrane-bound dolichyl-phosphate-mannose-protein mannosyltransferase
VGLGYRYFNNRGENKYVVIIHRYLMKYRLALGIKERRTRRIAENV